MDENNAKLADYTEKLAIYTKKLAVATIVLTVATICLLIVAGLSLSTTQDISESNEKLTNVTEEFYSYHPPNVSLISGYIGKLYVLKKNNSETYLTVFGYYSPYNSASADDIALVQQAHIGESFIGENGAVTVVEGVITPFPVIQGKFSGELPLMSTLKIRQSIEMNVTIDVEIPPIYLNVTHPLNRTLLANLTATEFAIINYTMGEEKATIHMDGGHTQPIDVRYTEDIEMYNHWKKTMLLQHGYSIYIIK
ncbi:MAG: hypothetical protein KAH86_05940 [Methanosarcinales archaeon]|nr:hypothetical protein [Methanosarcinales archaeon]